MRKRYVALKGLLSLLWSVAYLLVSAQSVVSGKVTDAATGAGIPSATVLVLETTQGTSTDGSGHYRLPTEKTGAVVQYSALGYKTVNRLINGSTSQTIDVELEETSQTLDEVVISGKGRYRNQKNPAVELIHKVIEHKLIHRLSRFDHVSFDAYEKIMMAVSDVPKFVKNSALTKGYRFAFENIDTTLVPGRSLLPIYLEETMSQRYLRLYPGASKTIVTANKKTTLDQRYVNNKNIETYFKFIHTDVDIYENNILILNKPFLSPTAEAAPLFYKFFITDTITTPEGRVAELTFVPRNPEDRLFSGKLQISLDGKYGIRRADIWIDHRANINWVNDVTIVLRFVRNEEGSFLLSYSDMKINFGLYEGKRGGFGQRTLVYSAYNVNSTIPAGIFSGQGSVAAEGADQLTKTDWEQERPIQLTPVEAKTYSNMDSLQHNRSFRKTLKLGYFLSQSYVKAGPVEFGPMERIYSFNDLEGSRIRLSGRTTPLFSEKLYAEAYAAYGFRDEQLKFFGGLAYSLNGRRAGSYPAHYLKVSYQEDAVEPGQVMGYMNGDSFIRSFRSGEQDKWSYYKAFELNHIIEFGNHVRLRSSLMSQRRDPAANLHFIRATANADTIPSLRTAEVGFDIRWAPHEEFFQRNLDRSPIINEYPVFHVRYNAGIKGLLGGEYNYHTLRFDVSKRLFLSQLGLADVNFGVGYIIGNVPFPLLDIPTASKSYALIPDSYALMNELEFVSDRYLKLAIEHRLHGFVLNKIPLLKKLKLREVVGFKLLYGDVRPENDPQYNPQLYRLPTDRAGNPTTFTLGRKPYMEASAGVENILNVLRVEYVRRLSYLNNPDIDRGGIRFSVKIDF